MKQSELGYPERKHTLRRTASKRYDKENVPPGKTNVKSVKCKSVGREFNELQNISSGCNNVEHNAQTTPVKQSFYNSQTTNKKTKTELLHSRQPMTPQVEQRAKESLMKENSYTCSSIEQRKSIRRKTTLNENDVAVLDMKRSLSVKQHFNKALSSCLESLPGRESEVTVVKDTICRLIQNNESGSLYVSGPPGTGKTACVTAVIREFLKVDVNCLLCKFANCVRCNNEAILLRTVGFSRDGTSVSTDRNSKNRPTIIVMDEIDQISNQEFLYKVFEWPLYRQSPDKSAILIIGIANALDLTDRLLPRLSFSRAKPTLLHFSPYTSNQLSTILQNRLQKCDHSGDPDPSTFTRTPHLPPASTKTHTVPAPVDRAAIELCARKVAASSGDARKALALCAKALHCAKEEALHSAQKAASLFDTPPRSPKVVKGLDKENDQNAIGCRVSISVMSRVLHEATTNRSGACDDSENSNSAPLHHKMILSTLARMTRDNHVTSFPANQIMTRYMTACTNKGIKSLDQSQMRMVLELLESRGIVTISKGKEFRNKKVILSGNLFEIVSANELDL